MKYTSKRRYEYDLVYINMACSLANLSHAIRSKVGCIIVSEDGQIISHGWNGMPYNMPNYCEHHEGDILVTNREVLHAESNAIAKCAKYNGTTQNAICYVTPSPCFECSKLIIQSGIKRVVYSNEYRITDGICFLLRCGVEVNFLDRESEKLYNITTDSEDNLVKTLIFDNNVGGSE